MQVDRQQPWTATLTSPLGPAGAAGALTVGEGAVQPPPGVAECLPHRAVFWKNIAPRKSRSQQHLGEWRVSTLITVPAKRCQRKERPQRERKLHHLLISEMNLRRTEASIHTFI